MKTKEKILQTALWLFNERGISQVSSRTISKEMGISYGNLTYYFSRKDDVVMALYTNMQQELEQRLAIIFQHVFEENFNKDSLKIIFELTEKYKFIYLSLTELTRQFPQIHQTERQYLENRDKIIKKVLGDLVRVGYFRPETETNSNYQLMTRGLGIIFNSWIIDAEIFYKGEKDKKIDFYVSLLYNVIMPCLTENGIRKFEEFKLSE